jgi:Glu-tRNA(Gln) amidotransferase subunit E-like FAD-binding protein
VAGRDRSALVGARADLGEALRASRARALVESRGRGWTIGGIRLRDFSDVLATEVQPGVLFAREIEGRVRVIACLDHRPVLLHGAAPAEGGLGERDWHAVREVLGSEGSNDALLLVRGPARDVETALDEIAARAAEVWDGVPSETRQALSDGTTDFERILPGPDRMYPDTDTEPVALTRARVEGVAATLPERPWDREAGLRDAGVGAQLARRLAVSPRYRLGRRVLAEGVFSPSLLASLLTDGITALRREGVAVDALEDERLLQALRWTAEQGRPDLAGEAIRMAAERNPLPESLPAVWEEGLPRTRRRRSRKPAGAAAVGSTKRAPRRRRPGSRAGS